MARARAFSASVQAPPFPASCPECGCAVYGRPLMEGHLAGAVCPACGWGQVSMPPEGWWERPREGRVLRFASGGE